MRISRYDRGYPHGDMLNSEARAVIEAEFVEIAPHQQRRTPMHALHEVIQWIKQRLQRV